MFPPNINQVNLLFPQPKHFLFQLLSHHVTSAHPLFSHFHFFILGTSFTVFNYLFTPSSGQLVLIQTNTDKVKKVRGRLKTTYLFVFFKFCPVSLYANTKNTKKHQNTVVISWSSTGEQNTSTIYKNNCF